MDVVANDRIPLMEFQKHTFMTNDLFVHWGKSLADDLDRFGYCKQ